MKKILATILVLAMSLSFTGCKQLSQKNVEKFLENSTTQLILTTPEGIVKARYDIYDGKYLSMVCKIDDTTLAQMFIDENNVYISPSTAELIYGINSKKWVKISYDKENNIPDEVASMLSEDELNELSDFGLVDFFKLLKAAGFKWDSKGNIAMKFDNKGLNEYLGAKFSFFKDIEIPEYNLTAKGKITDEKLSMVFYGEDSLKIQFSIKQHNNKASDSSYYKVIDNSVDYESLVGINV